MVVHFVDLGPLTMVVEVAVSELNQGGTLGFVGVHTKGEPWVFDRLVFLRR